MLYWEPSSQIPSPIHAALAQLPTQSKSLPSEHGDCDESPQSSPSIPKFVHVKSMAY